MLIRHHSRLPKQQQQQQQQQQQDNNNNTKTVFRSPLSPEAVRRWLHTSHAEIVPAHGSCPVRSCPVGLPIGDL